MSDFIKIKKLKKLLGIQSDIAIRRELKKALTIEDSGVFKFGNEYLVDYNLYKRYLLTKNKGTKCENLTNSVKGAKNTTLTTMKKEQDSASVFQLAQALKMSQ